MKKTFLLAALTLIVCLAEGRSLADLFEKNKHSVVTIYVNESLNAGTGDPRNFTSSMGLGSGVLVREGIVVTAAHAVGNADQIASGW